MTAMRQSVAVEVGQHVPECGELLEIQDVTPPERVYDYVFRQTFARLEARVNGHLIKQYGEFNDYYGQGTCVATAIKEARRITEKLGLNKPVESVEFVVLKITEHHRMRPVERTPIVGASPALRFEPLSYGSHAQLLEDTTVEVWSSLRGDLV